MNKQEFLALDDKAKLQYLNELAANGKSISEICSDLGFSKDELGKQGFIPVGNKFMLKPMKGYGTTVRSGNEYTDRFK